MLLPFFEWMEGVAVYGSTIYLGPAVNIVHLCAMVTFLGALMVVDLRLMGTGLTHQPVAVVARDARPWLLGALGHPGHHRRAGADGHGHAAVRQLGLLGEDVPAGPRAHLHLHRAQPRGVCRRGQVGGGTAKFVGLLSILIWLSVAALARLIMMIPANTFEWLVGGSGQ